MTGTEYEVPPEVIEAVRLRQLLDVERLAAIAHEMWVHWATQLLKSGERLSQERRARWARLVISDYSELTEAEKEIDRKWARRLAGLSPDEGTPHAAAPDQDGQRPEAGPA